MREACAAEGGVEVDTQGDAFFVAFPTAPGALAAAQASLRRGSRRARSPCASACTRERRLLTEEGYVGDRRPPCGPYRRLRARRAGAGLVLDRRARRRGAPGRPRRAPAQGPLRPERIYQLGEEDFPPLKSSTARTCPSRRPPSSAARAELARSSSLSRRGRASAHADRPGRNGQDAARAAGGRLASDAYPDGVYWVPLAPLRDPALVLATAGQTLGSKNGIAEHIQDKAMLLPLRQLRAGGGGGARAGRARRPPAPTSTSSSRAASACASRASRPTPCPRSPSRTARRSSARAHARSIPPSPRARRCVSSASASTSSPLAIELAAARTALFSPEQLLDKLAQRLDLLKGGATPIPASRRSGRRSSGRTTSSQTTSSASFARLAVFAAAARSRQPRRSPAPTSTPCSRSSTRASCAGATRRRPAATGCSRRFASTRPSGSPEARKPTRSATATSIGSSPSPRGMPGVQPRRGARQHPRALDWAGAQPGGGGSTAHRCRRGALAGSGVRP